jgi:hypothetical protein
MEHIDFEVALSALIDNNPFQTIATFVFADDKPNQNRQGIPFSEFERIAKSAIGMPVKMKFTGYGTGNHEGSIPIGVIQNMEIKTISDDFHQLVAQAALWNGEYPEEIAWLKKAFADGKAPGISYEINYNEFDTIDSVQWLKNSFTGAATFVETPAYGTRTALIALASTTDKQTLEEGILAIAEKLSAPKGGNSVDEKELEALKSERDNFKAEAATKQQEIESLTTKIGEKETELETLKTENTNLKTAALVDSRLREYQSAGFTLEAEASEAKKTLFASFNDEQWTSYLADLVAIKAAAAKAAPAGNQALASLKVNNIPKPEDATLVDFNSLRSGLRSLARPNQVE